MFTTPRNVNFTRFYAILRDFARLCAILRDFTRSLLYLVSSFTWTPRKPENTVIDIRYPRQTYQTNLIEFRSVTFMQLPDPYIISIFECLLFILLHPCSSFLPRSSFSDRSSILKCRCFVCNAKRQRVIFHIPFE